MILSILIPTTTDRQADFERLESELQKQIGNKQVEVFSLCDNKEVSVGAKRNELYKMAQGKYSVMIDSDDWVPPYYIKEVLKAAKQDKDCIGYIEACLINGEEKKSLISLKCEKWCEFSPAKEGFHYHRTPFFKVPIKTEICKYVGVKDMRFAEDHDFAKRVHMMLKDEAFINKEMYYYHANSMTREEHNKRYGITA